MTQYAPEPTDIIETAAPRTSTLAVASVVMSIICCIPGLGAIGALLGVGSIVAISKSEREIRGKGLAIAGVVIGLLTTFLWIGLAYGVSAGVKKLSQYSQAIASIDANDRQTLSNWLTPDTDARLTDDEIIAFRDAYQADRGAYVSVPDNMADLFSTYMTVGQQIRSVQKDSRAVGYANPIPLPVEFDQGVALVIIAADNSQIGAGGMPLAENIGYVAKDGSIVWLVDPSTP